MLARKERTTLEVRQWLAEKGADEDQIGDLIGRLEEALVLDDERFAVEFARDKRELSGWGRARIGKALAERGIANDLIEEVTSEAEGTEVERATEILLSRGFRLDDPADRRRALGLLGRRGYAAEDAYEAVRQVARSGGLDLAGADGSEEFGQ